MSNLLVLHFKLLFSVSPENLKSASTGEDKNEIFC